MQAIIRSVLAIGAVALSALSTVAHSQGIPQSCMQTFNVKDKGFSTGNSTVSCVLLEKRRVSLSIEVEKTPDTGEIDGAAVAKKLDAFEASIKKHEDSKNWLAMGEAITGNTLATIGLGTCLNSAGAGCLLAGVGKVMALHGLVETANSEADKTSRANEMRAFIDSIRKDVVGKKSQAKATRDRMLGDAIAMCTAVKTNCL